MSYLRRAVLAALLVTLPVAAANAQAVRETIAKHPTWVYTPTTTLENGKRGLLVALHGCKQTYGELWKWGNLQAAADARGMVIAVPGVGKNPWGPGCWNYDGGTDSGHHVAELVDLTRTLVGRPGLAIDPAHVYVAGLSSGASMSLDVACAAPDLFAGVGAVSGPSVGSMQMMATSGPLMAGNVAAATARCRSMAGANASAFATQIANVATGDMDKGAEKARYPHSEGDTRHPGQYAVIPVQWTHDNAESFRTLYNAGPLSGATPVAGGQATEWYAAADGKPRVTKLVIADVGHAWPAGSGKPNRASTGGVWIAQSGLNYPDYITGWFLANNLRAGAGTPAPTPQPDPRKDWSCVDYQANNYEHVKAGRAYDRWGVAYAMGSNQPIGWDNALLVTRMSQPLPGFYTLGQCAR